MNELHDAIAKGLVDRGLLIEAGFVAMIDGAPFGGKTPEQREDLKLAYFAGAQHLWASIMAIMDPGIEPTSSDLRRMDLIDRELKGWAAKLAASMIQVKGHA